jgi:hypothetical protein
MTARSPSLPYGRALDFLPNGLAELAAASTELSYAADGAGLLAGAV